MKPPLTALIACLGLLLIASRAHALTIARAGQAEAVIVVPAGSKPAGAADLERVRLVATGLEYTRKTRDLLAAAAAVRAGKSTREDFNRIKAETDKYYSTLKGSLAVDVSHDIQSCLSLTPDQ